MGKSVPQSAHLIFDPLAEESTMTCFPQAGQANFKCIGSLSGGEQLDDRRRRWQFNKAGGKRMVPTKT
jgi:hypothetical protein